jgi:hypothetical protein
MSVLSQALNAAGDARFDMEVQMDQRKPAAPAPAPGMSRGGAADPGQGAGSEPAAPRAPAPAVEQLISRQLRAIFDEVVNEPVPDRFVKLLEELERKRSGGS